MIASPGSGSALRLPRWVIGLQLAILVAAAVHIYLVDYVADDSFISLRYAKHLAGGQGLVYNPGERVEGYTNFLWVVLLAGVNWIWPAVDLPLTARLLGTAASLLIVLIVLRFSTDGARAPAAGLLAGACLMAHSGFVAWAGAGLETGQFSLLVLSAAMIQARTLGSGRFDPLVPLLLALAALTRPEGAIFFSACLAALVVSEFRWPITRPGLFTVIRIAARFAGLFALVYVPYFVWRYGYYGDLLPNTAYAKVAPASLQVGRGARYVWSYVVQYGVLFWILPVVIYLWRCRDRVAWFFAWLVFVGLAYVLRVGGDGLAFHRFVVHLAPLMYAVVAAALVDGYRRYVAPRTGRSLRFALAAVTVVGLLAVTGRATWTSLLLPERARWFEPQAEMSFPGDGTLHSYVWFDNYFVDRLTIAARYLEQHAEPNSLVASTPAGAIGYHMNHRVLDMLGLTDRHIAHTSELYMGGWRAGHEKGDGAYVLARAPDYILMGNVAVLPYALTETTMARKLVLKSEHELWEIPEFHKRYELVSVRIADDGPFQFFTFFRRKP